MTDTMSQFSQNVDRTILEEVGGLSPGAEESMELFSNTLTKGGYTLWDNLQRMCTRSNLMYPNFVTYYLYWYSITKLMVICNL